MSVAAPTVAALLRELREEIIARWISVERARREPLSTLDMHDLVDSLPVLLDELADHLESHLEDARFDVPILETAARHGAQRVSLRIPLAYLVDEYSILRRLLTQLIRETGRAVDPDEVEQLHAALDAAIIRSVTAYVASIDTARDRMIGIVGHDLRNPVNAIALGAEALKTRIPAESPEGRIVTRIAHSSERAARMIHDLLDYSQASSHGAIPINPARANLAAVISHVVEETRQAFPQRTIVLETPAPAEAGALDGVWDADRIAQVVSNLTRNALQHSLAATPVTVRAWALDERHVCVEVHNDGAPIPPTLLPQLFEPFLQGEQGNGRREGNVGLGLFIAHEIVRGHRGQITADSRAGFGTTFRVVLPRWEFEG